VDKIHFAWDKKGVPILRSHGRLLFVLFEDEGGVGLGLFSTYRGVVWLDWVSSSPEVSENFLEFAR